MTIFNHHRCNSTCTSRNDSTNKSKELLTTKYRYDDDIGTLFSHNWLNWTTHQ